MATRPLAPCAPPPWPRASAAARPPPWPHELCRRAPLRHGRATSGAVRPSAMAASLCSRAPPPLPLQLAPPPIPAWPRASAAASLRSRATSATISMDQLLQLPPPSAAVFLRSMRLPLSVAAPAPASALPYRLLHLVGVEGCAWQSPAALQGRRSARAPARIDLRRAESRWGRLQAISVKRNMLIEHALRPGMPNVEDSNDEIRIFSGKVDDVVDETDSLSKSVEKSSVEMKNVVYTNLASHSEKSELQMADSFTVSKDHDRTSITEDHDANDDFVEHIVSQLNSLECEIEQYVNSQVATDVDIQQSMNGKWHKLSTVLKLITETRERIAKMLDNTGSEAGSDGLR